MSPDDRDSRTTDQRRPRLARDRPSRRSRAELRAQLAALRRRLEAAESRLETLEATTVDSDGSLRACTTCGRVCVRHGFDDRCPYCRKGELRSL